MVPTDGSINLATRPLVQLTPSEISMAAHVGIQRMAENLAQERAERYGATEDVWGPHIEGALGECARAKFSGVYWTGKGAVREPDASDGEDTRTTKYRSGHLMIHEDDPGNRVYWLLVGVEGRYRVVGRAVAGWAKRECWWRTDTGRPAFFVPQDQVVPPGEPLPGAMLLLWPDTVPRPGSGAVKRRVGAMPPARAWLDMEEK